jgi:uncharacterized protein YoxC
MSKSINKTSLVVTISAIALIITGCGASKTTQCSSVSKIVEEVKTSTDELTKKMKTTDPRGDKGLQLINNMAAKYQVSSKTMRELDLQDGKLKGFQSRFTSIYAIYSKVSDGMASAIKAKDLQAFNKVSAEADSTAAEEKSLDKELAEYCSAK